MDCHVYYRSWPNKALRVITVSDSDTPKAALAEVALHLKNEKEMHFKPLMALIVGGKV